MLNIPRYERIWLTLGGSSIVVFLLLTGFMAVSMNLNPPNHLETIDPQAVSTTAPFDVPGLREIGPNEYEIVMVARLFSFQPEDITIPVGAKVRFKVTSPDVVHGLQIPHTNVNMMVVPGHITEYTYTFKNPGDYLILCNEYCGTGHHLMLSRIVVQ